MILKGPDISSQVPFISALFTIKKMIYTVHAVYSLIQYEIWIKWYAFKEVFSMGVLFPVYAIFVLLIFNSLTHQFCMKMEMKERKQSTVFRVINIMILVLLLSSYVKVLNVTT